MLPSPYQVLSCQRIILAVRRGFGSYIFIYICRAMPEHRSPM